jgi:hypothetical protein
MEEIIDNSIKDVVVFRKAQIGDKEINSVDARTLHQALESQQQFADWIKAKVLNNPFFVSHLLRGKPRSL